VAHKPGVRRVLLRSIKTLKHINKVPVKEFWERVAVGDIPKPK